MSILIFFRRACVTRQFGDGRVRFPLGPLKVEGNRSEKPQENEEKHEKEMGYGGKCGKMRKLQEGNAGKPEGMLEEHGGGRQNCAKAVTQSQADGRKVRNRRSAESNGRWGSDQDSLQGDEQ